MLPKLTARMSPFPWGSNEARKNAGRSAFANCCRPFLKLMLEARRNAELSPFPWGSNEARSDAGRSTRITRQQPPSACGSMSGLECWPEYLGKPLAAILGKSSEGPNERWTEYLGAARRSNGARETTGRSTRPAQQRHLE